MPRAKNAKASGAIKKVGTKKKSGYDKPEPVPLGEVITDLSNVRWKIGPSIGIGGFGEIYLSCKLQDAPKDLDDYKYVAKFEPHRNGPLFVEMHFYMRNAKKESIQEFCRKKSIKKIGMPHFVGHGSHDVDGAKHRFLIIPRYGKDIAYYFSRNGNKFPPHTIYRLAIQMLDVYEYIHNCKYVHADLKDSNMLLEFGAKSNDQVYLVDYGLASHYNTGDYRPNPKKKHNGTIEYTSRDAHNGVLTMRGDMEILAYNLIHWFGVELPWVKNKLLNDPQKVQASKEDFMKNIDSSLTNLFSEVPIPVKRYIDRVLSLNHDQTPNYVECKKIFEEGLRILKKPLQGDLELQSTGLGVSPKIKNNPKRPKILQPAQNRPNNQSSPLKRLGNETDGPSSKRNKEGPSSPKNIRNEKKTIPKNDDNISPIIIVNKNIKNSRLPKYDGGTTINNVNSKSTKTYTVDVELDVSLDANVVVNVIRKKRDEEKTTGTKNSPVSRNRLSADTSDTPSPRRSGRKCK